MAARLTTYLVVAIVATTLIAGLIVGAQREDNDGPVDLIVHNAALYVADGDGTMAEAVAVRGNQILRVGSDREILRLQRPQTIVIDAKGAAVVPGFNDAHARLVEAGLASRGVDLLDATAASDVRARITAWSEGHPDSEWITGRGWSESSLGGAVPDRQFLDAVVADRPVHLLSADGTRAWLNTRALAAAGIHKDTPAPADGIIQKDARSGEPTGLLTGAATALVTARLPHASHEERLRAARDAIAAAHREGVTSIQDPGVNPSDIALYDELRRDGDLDLRVYAGLSLDGTVDDGLLSRIDGLWKEHADDPLLKTGAMSIDLDGTLGSRTAATLEPYEGGAAGSGSLRIPRDDLNRFVRLLDARGWQVMTHAAGDRAVRIALDAYVHAARSNPTPGRGRRHRVEGAQLVDVADLPRFGMMGVLASLQPGMGSPTTSRTEALTRSLGASRAARAWPAASLIAREARIAFGSGWPSAPLSPMAGIHAAVTRTTPLGQPAGGWTPSERVRLAAALDAYTSGAAYASFDEQRKGSLAPGMLADIVILSADIFTNPPARLAATDVAVTIFDGKVVYRKDAKGTN